MTYHVANVTVNAPTSYHVANVTVTASSPGFHVANVTVTPSVAVWYQKYGGTWHPSNLYVKTGGNWIPI